MNLKSFFSAQNLFGFNTAYVSSQEKLVLLVAAIIFLIGIVFRIAASLAPNPVDQKLRQKLYRVFVFFGIAETLWYLCRYENALFFGSHFIALLIGVIALVWLIAIVWTTLRTYAEEKKAWEKEQLRQKYLPQ